MKPDREALTEALGILHLVLLEGSTIPVREKIRDFLERETVPVRRHGLGEVIDRPPQEGEKHIHFWHVVSSGPVGSSPVRLYACEGCGLLELNVRGGGGAFSYSPTT